MSYLLEVFLAKEVVEAWSGGRGGYQPAVKEKCAAVIHYAVNDAFLEVDGHDTAAGPKDGSARSGEDPPAQ